MQNSDSPVLSTLPQAKTILKVFFERIPHLYVIIDAVDECETADQRKLLIGTFEDLVRKCDSYSPGKLRVLIFSQPMFEIKKSLPSADTLTLAPEHNVDDIRKYCQRRTRELEKFEFNGQCLQDVVEIICTRADGKDHLISKFVRLPFSNLVLGMFLFAKLVMNNLARQPTRARFATEITSANLPSKINEVFVYEA